MLFVPGIIAVSVHNKQLIRITRDNWQPLIWEFLLYSFGIMLAVNFVMFLTSPNRSVSYSPWMLQADNNVLQAGFVFKYTLVAAVVAFVLPKLWEHYSYFFDKQKKRPQSKIEDDE
jgi:hypothetical protein